MCPDPNIGVELLDVIDLNGNSLSSSDYYSGSIVSLTNQQFINNVFPIRISS